MNTFYEPLLQMEAFDQIREALKKEERLQLITGCVDSQKTHLMYGLGRDYPVKLILTYSELKAKEIFEEYQTLKEDVFYYPAKDFLFFHADIQGNELLRQRVMAVSRLLEKGEAPGLSATMAAQSPAESASKHAFDPPVTRCAAPKRFMSFSSAERAAMYVSSVPSRTVVPLRLPAVRYFESPRTMSCSAFSR